MPLFAELNQELERLQELLYAQSKHKVLIVLQATDTGGKDGTIRHVFDGVNPQGVRVASFKQPTKAELAHDFLWRAHQQAPGNGEIVIFKTRIRFQRFQKSQSGSESRGPKSHKKSQSTIRIRNTLNNNIFQKVQDHDDVINNPNCIDLVEAFDSSIHYALVTQERFPPLRS